MVGNSSIAAATPERRIRQQGQVLALLFGSGATLVLVALAFPFFRGANVAVLLTIIAFAYLCSTVLLFLTNAGRLPRWVPAAGIATGSTLIAVGSYFAGDGGTAVIAVFYLFATAYSFFYFPTRLAVAQVAYAAATYAIALLEAGLTTAAAQWIIIMGAATVGGGVVGRLGAISRQSLEIEQEAMETLRQAEQIRTTYLRTLVHQTRTPLATVIGFADVLATNWQQLDPAMVPDLLERLRDGARKLERTFDDLLLLERSAVGLLEPQLVPTDVGELVRQVVANAGAADRHLTVDAPSLISKVDPHLIQRAVDNLVQNACKHPPPGSHVTVSLSATQQGVLITVADDGPGVPDHLKADIFDPFVRGPTEAPGSGVGLSLVGAFARLHRGRAWVEDGAGGGARFHLLLAHRNTDSVTTADTLPTSAPRPAV